MKYLAELTIPDEEWEKTGDYNEFDADQRLSGLALTINGVAYHIEAFEIDSAETERPYQQHLRDGEADQALGLLAGDGGFPVETTIINGREYALLLHPFAV